MLQTFSVTQHYTDKFSRSYLRLANITGAAAVANLTELDGTARSVNYPENEGTRVHLHGFQFLDLTPRGDINCYATLCFV